MKIFGKELKFNGFDIWHKGNLTPSKVATSNNYNDLDNKPTSLPANGGNADTVDGKHASEFMDIYGKPSGTFQLGRTFYNVTNFEAATTTTEIVIKTKIPFLSSNSMPMIRLQGYAYGQQAPIGLQLAYYIFNSTYVNGGVVSLGAWKPLVKLFSYTDGGVKYTAIALIGSIYYPRFSVDLVDIWGGTNRDYSQGWTVEYTTSGSESIIGTDDLYTVPYKYPYTASDLGASVIGHKHDEIYYTKIESDGKFEPKNTNIQAHISNVSNPHNTTKVHVGLGDVDNVKQASKTEFDNHVNNTSNPHSVTKSQVGLGNVQNYGIATQAEAEAGTSDTKYMTPLRVKQAIDKFKPKKVSELENDKNYVTQSELGNAGYGDMMKSIYDKNSNGIVDNAEKVNGFTVETNVPANAKFTDTVTTINGKTGAITKADIVALGIPAQDTNTTYSEITTAEIDAGTASTLRTITARRVKYIMDKVKSDFPTSLPANGGHATSAKHLIGDDTRDVNSPPSEYMNGGSRYEGRAGWQTEFKRTTSIGVTSFLSGTYCFLETKTPWSNPSGGYPIQIAYGNGNPVWRVGTSNATWSEWQPLSKSLHIGTSAPSNHNIGWVDTSL